MKIKNIYIKENISTKNEYAIESDEKYSMLPSLKWNKSGTKFSVKFNHPMSDTKKGNQYFKIKD